MLLDEGSGGLKIEVIAAPSGKPQLSSNDDSLVLMATYRSKRLLFPGDLESAGISSLLQENVRLGADVMLLPHHGNRDPMVGPLVHRVAPAIALASRASTLRGSPMDSIVTRTGAQLLDTASLGALRIQIDGESAIEVSSYLRDDSWFVETAPGGVSR